MKMEYDLVEIDVDEEGELSQLFKVQSIPLFVFLQNKQEKDRILGTDEEELTKFFINCNRKANQIDLPVLKIAEVNGDLPV